MLLQPGNYFVRVLVRQKNWIADLFDVSVSDNQRHGDRTVSSSGTVTRNDEKNGAMGPSSAACAHVLREIL
jgi:hypothetical protein